MLGGAAALSLAGRADADSDPLPSWNAGPARDAIVKFVHATTDASSSNFVPVTERIATFDQDGTLWVEHPIYTQLVFCFDRVPALVKAKPELAKVEPFRTVLSGAGESIARLGVASRALARSAGVSRQTLYELKDRCGSSDDLELAVMQGAVTRPRVTLDELAEAVGRDAADVKPVVTGLVGAKYARWEGRRMSAAR